MRNFWRTACIGAVLGAGSAICHNAMHAELSIDAYMGILICTTLIVAMVLSIIAVAITVISDYIG